MATSRSKQLVFPRISDARNASADANASAAKPNCRTKPGRASRMDSSSSTTDTNDGSVVMNARSVTVFHSLESKTKTWHLDRHSALPKDGRDVSRLWSG